MPQRNGYLQNERYNASDNRMTNTALWSRTGYDGPITPYESQSGVVQTIDQLALKVVEKGTGANMSVNVQPGHAMITGYEQQRGTYGCCLDVQKNLVVSAAHVSFPRIDSVFAIIYDGDYGDASSTFDTILVQGVAAASPTAPSEPNLQCFRLANIAVASGATSITNANITDFRTFVAPINTRLTITSTPSVELPDLQHLYRISNSKWEIYENSRFTPVFATTGYEWTTYTPSLTSSGTNPTLGPGAVTYGEYTRVPGSEWVFLQGMIKFGTSATSQGTGTYRVSTPFTFISESSVGDTCGGIAMFVDDSSSPDKYHMGWCGPNAGTNYLNLTTPASVSFDVSATVPMTWSDNDTIYFSMTFPTSAVTT